MPVTWQDPTITRTRSGCHAAYPQACNCQQEPVARNGSKSGALDWQNGLSCRKMYGVKQRVELWEPYLRSFVFVRIDIT